MAKSYFSVREVKAGFEEVLNDNNAALGELDAAVKSIALDKAGIEETYQRGLDKFVTSIIHPMNSDALKKLSYWMPSRSEEGFASRYLEREHQGRIRASQEAEIRLNGLTATHGSVQQMEKKYTVLSATAGGLKEDERKLAKTVSTIAENLAPVDAFNKRVATGKAKLDEEGIGYFSSKKGFSHVWAYLFDGHYRQGRAVIKAFSPNKDGIVAAQKSLTSFKAELFEKNEAKETAQEKAKAAEQVLTEMQTVEAQVHSEQKLRDVLKADIVDAMKDADRFGKVAKSLEGIFPQLLLEQRAKIENMAKLQEGAEKTRSAVRDANKKLDVHMPKLKKAVSRAGSKKISIDLDGIKAGYKPLQKGVRQQAKQMKQRSAAVGKYRYQPAPVASSAAASPAGGINALDVVMVAMILDMNNSIPDIPDVDVGGSFNDAVSGIDAGSFDVPDISSLDISVPDISVPDISIDTGGFSGGDFGGFSGGDFGGF